MVTGSEPVEGRVRQIMRDLILVHSSDLHINTDHGRDELASLHRVIRAAQEADAGLVLLAGDVFDHNRLPLALVDGAVRVMQDSGLPFMILPGNHDPLTPDSVYYRGGFADLPGVHVIGMTSQDVVSIPELDLQVWGRAHRDYYSMLPLETPPASQARWHVVMAHGHLVSHPHDHGRSWPITRNEINATGADYVALGHWDSAFSAEAGRVPAFYSGSPSLARTVNVVRLSPDGAVRVSRRPC